MSKTINTGSARASSGGGPCVEMFVIYKIVFLLASLFAGNTLAHNGCRQCSGVLRLTFDSYVPRAVAEKLVGPRLGTCATGNEYAIDRVSNPAGACSGNSGNCNYWNFDVTVWRYCSNGPIVDRILANPCVDGICSSSNKLNMNCHKSVDCHSKCTVSDC